MMRLLGRSAYFLIFPTLVAIGFANYVFAAPGTGAPSSMICEKYIGSGRGQEIVQTFDLPTVRSWVRVEPALKNAGIVTDFLWR
jgi:hypothetical protein